MMALRAPDEQNQEAPPPAMKDLQVATPLALTPLQAAPPPASTSTSSLGPPPADPAMSHYAMRSGEYPSL